MLIIMGVQLIGLGIIGDLIEKQRRLTEQISYMLKEKKINNEYGIYLPVNNELPYLERKKG